MVVLVFLVSVFLLTSMLSFENYYQVKKTYSQDQYGKWYYMAGIIEEKPYALEEYLKIIDSHDMEYGYLYKQGYDNHGCEIASVTNHLYDFCKLNLISGHYPNQDHEVMISRSYLEQFGYQMNQTISLSINNADNQDYIIVGIMETENAQFPDIYTSLLQGQKCIVADREIPIIDEDHLKVDYGFVNPYGYSANENVAQYDLSSRQIVIFVEAFCLIAFALASSTSVPLKRRSKEFALLRGIGMTTCQLVIMVLYEMILTSFITIMLANTVSLGTVYLVMRYFEQQFGYFNCYYSLGTIVFCTCLLLLCTLSATLYPMYQSAKYSLSGAFDSQTFQYIQVRYRHLKYQKKWRLALRELKVYKKMTLSLILIFSVLIIYCTCGFMDPQNEDIVYSSRKDLPFHYVQYYSNSLSDYHYIQSLNIPHTIAYRYANKHVNVLWKQDNYMIDNIKPIDDMQWFENCKINGRLPQNQYEVIASEGVAFYKEVPENSYESYDMSLDDTFVMDGHEYKVVGYLQPNQVINDVEICYVPEMTLYVLPIVFDSLFSYEETRFQIRSYYDHNQKKDFIIQNLDDRDYTVLDNSVYWDDIIFEYSNLDPQIIIIPGIICLIFCYFLNKNQIYNHRRDYDLYRLIGMTKKDLMLKQFYKALLVILVIIVIELFWCIMICIDYGMIILPFDYIILSIVGVFIVVSVIYCLPFVHFFHEDLLSSFSSL